MINRNMLFQGPAIGLPLLRSTFLGLGCNKVESGNTVHLINKSTIIFMPKSSFSETTAVAEIEWKGFRESGASGSGASDHLASNHAAALNFPISTTAYKLKAVI